MLESHTERFDDFLESETESELMDTDAQEHSLQMQKAAARFLLSLKAYASSS